MKLENQVISLDNAKKLKNLGVNRESYFEWVLRYEAWEIWCQWIKSDYETGAEKEFIPAYSVAELGMMLPDDCGTSRDHDLGFTIYTYDKTDTGEFFINHYHTTDTEADARARMIIDLLENNAITIEDVNGKD